MATVYEINKGINRSIEFRGIKAQYIIYLAVGMVALLLLFSILYICHLKLLFCLAIVAVAGTAWVVTIQRLSREYGENGLLKHLARKKLPKAVVCKSRLLFTQLKENTNAQK